MRPFDVLLGATSIAAEVMGKKREIGTLEKGKARRHRAAERRPRDRISATPKRSSES